MTILPFVADVIVFTLDAHEEGVAILDYQCKGGYIQHQTERRECNCKDKQHSFHPLPKGP